MQIRGHCQVCGRTQAVRGTMAKHGYEVKNRGNYGWFSGVCPGHLHAPLETNREELDNTVAWLRRHADDLMAEAADLRTGRLVPKTARTGRVVFNEQRKPVPEVVAWEAASQYHRDQEIARLIFKAEHRADHAKSDAEGLLALAAKVHGQPLQQIEKAAAPEPILAGDRRQGPRRVLIAGRVNAGTVAWTTDDGFKGRMSTRSWRLLPKVVA